MNGKVLVVLASRDRPGALKVMLETFHATQSGNADVVVYVDEDQREQYASLRCSQVIGPRIGPVGSLNRLVEMYPGYSVYGAATDDCRFLTPNWDQWLLETTARFPGQIGAMSPHQPRSNRMDFPYVTGRWVEALGCLCPSTATHYYWDVAVEIIAEQLGCLAWASDEEFSIEHDEMMPVRDKDELLRMLYKDGREVLLTLAFKRKEMMMKLVEARESVAV
jgi:hypothetical protein